MSTGPSLFVLYCAAMGFPDLLVTEIFHSLQGETSLMGVPFAFIRLTGCNLRCVYCDSAYAFKGGKRLRIAEVMDTIRPYEVKNVLLTGGEPLLQKNTPELARTLVEASYDVSIETHGEVSIQNIAKIARIVMDIKTPSSGMCRMGFEKNFKFLKPEDEIKFVIVSTEDYTWAKTLVKSGRLPTREVLFSPAQPAIDSPGKFPGVSLTWLAEKILEDRLPVRLQYQMHKLIWGADRKGV
jgi:7-carboxy-7-deazaguanine synthase